MENYGNSELQQEPSSGSRTVDQSSIPAVLQLRANGHAEQDRAEIRRNSHRSHIRWEQDVVDNEHMDKKKTKICCIYHPSEPDEDVEVHMGHSDCSSDSSSGSSSESDNDSGYNFEQRRQRRIERRHNKLTKRANSTPNAYEIQPDYSNHRQRIQNQNEQNN